MKNLDLIWKKVLTSIKKEITPTSFKTWFMPLKAVKIDNDLNLLNLSIHDPFFMGVLKERYIGIIERAVKDVLKKPYKVAIELESDIAEDETENSSPSPGSKNYKTVSEPVFNNEFILDPNYSFDNFIVGDNNKYAYVASLAVAESPSELYNPLFIYGGSGLGKTHLMHAIGHFVLENHTHLKVLYISSEMFTNEFIKALGNSKKTGGMSAFQRKYRSIDVLLIDDIQFIEGKEATETEFFNTFNRLYESNKQIIISSDRAPSDMKILDERLKSRFQWNLVADIQPPEFETRVAILRSKAELDNIEITDDVSEVISFIAEKIKFNVRELEGAFSRVTGFSALLNEKTDMKFAKKILKDLAASGEFNINCETIKKHVCNEYGIKLSDIESPKRTRNLTVPRQIAMYLCREMTDSSLPKIGKAFGGRDHTTVLHAHSKISKELKINSVLKDEIDNITDIINES